MALAGPVLVTARSARAWTKVEAVPLLLPASGSVVLLVAVAVLLSSAPSGTLGLTCATTAKLAEAPAASVAILSLTFLPTRRTSEPGPLVWVWETKLSPAGSRSDRATAWASLGPL